MLLYRYLLHYGLLLHIMSQYLCLFSLILQGLHEEGECQQLEFWAGKGANIRDLFCTTPKVLKLHGSVFGNNNKYWAEEISEGAHPPSTRVGGAPYPLGRAPYLMGPLAAFRWPSFAIWILLTWKKIISKLSGWNTAAARRNLGGTNLGLRRSCSTGETSLRDGELSPSSSPTILSSGGGQSPSTSLPAPSPLKP